MKKMFLIFLIASLMISLVSPAPAFATTPLTATACETNVAAGDTVDLTVSFSDNPGVAAWMFELTWDPEVFTLDENSLSAGAGFSSGTLLSHEKNSGHLVVSWFSARNSSANGEAFSLKLKAADTASGSHSVLLSCSAENTINTDEVSVPVICENGTISITAADSGTPSPDDESGSENTSEQEIPSDSTNNRPESSLFTDVKADAYYHNAVYWAVDRGITNGIDATHFSPHSACTRAQTVTFLWRAAGSPEPKDLSNPFTDVSPDRYYYKAVLWAVAEGITRGTDETHFSPNATVTRAQTITFLWRAGNCPPPKASDSFADVAPDAYYATAVQWAAARGITGGTGDNSFSPNSPCVRAQIVTFLYRNELGGNDQ